MYIVKEYGSRTEYEDAQEAASYIVHCEDYISGMEPDLDEMLVESYGRIDIGRRTFDAAEVLRAVDEEYYDEMYREKQECCAENDEDYVYDQLSRMSDGDEENFYGIEVEFHEDLEEEEDEENLEMKEDFRELFV